ncbi:MAG: hypothetical protein ACPF8V_10080 [Luteibaculum sp.]
MRIAVSIVLIGGIFFKLGCNAFILANFAWNQSQIIQQFCENISKPELQCNGKCHLKKSLIDIADQDQQKVPSLVKTSEEPATPSSLRFAFASNSIHTASSYFFHTNNFSSRDVSPAEPPPNSLV